MSSRTDPVLWATVLIVFAVSVTLAVSRYARVDPASWDLGIYVQAVRQYAEFDPPISQIRGPDFHVLGGHWHPILMTLAPAWWIAPSPVTLLVAQALLVAVSIPPVYRCAGELLGPGEARLIAPAYGLSYGLVNLSWWDFHEVAFAVPLLACSLSALARRRWLTAACWAVPLVAVKEDQGLAVAAIGIVLAAVSRRWILGAALAVWGAGWSLLAVYVLIPHFNPQGEYVFWRYGGSLEHLLRGVDVKLETLLLAVLTVGLVALRSPIAFVGLPGLALRLWSSNPSYWGSNWHYSATLMPILFVAAIDGIARLRVRRAVGQATRLGAWLSHHAPAMIVAAAAVGALSSPLSQLLNPANFRLDEHDRAAWAAIDVIPDDATVVASMDELAPLAARTETAWWSTDWRTPEWVLFDKESSDWKVDIDVILDRYPGYEIAFERDGIWVLRRR